VPLPFSTCSSGTASLRDMVLGLLLILVGALAVVASVFTATGDNVQLLGLDISAVGIYLVGLGSGLALLWGFGLTKWGTKRSLRQRRESKQLNDLSEKLDKREADRRGDEDKDKDDRSY
jgi:hypothetical protein